jgi:OOP family OmpA-OmpF porin
MKNSTLRKTIAIALAASSFAAVASAQTMSPDTTMKPTTNGARVFGGRGQYNTWSIGLNAGILSPKLATGGVNDYNKAEIDFGYGLSIRNQLAHSFGLQLDAHIGQVYSKNNPARDNRLNDATKFGSATLSGVVNVATIDFLRRKNSVNFFVNAGAGLVVYHPQFTLPNGTTPNTAAAGGFYNADGSKHYARELVIPVGAGVKFRLTDMVALNFGYTENFVDGDNFDGLNRAYPTKDHYSYGYGGVEFTLGSKSKPSLEWVNPVAMMYDELYDEALRQEVAALKTRVGNVESSVNDLKKDSDGDGVSDQFDKCPNTPAGTVVDGAGCEIHFPKPDTVKAAAMVAPYSNIQFDFDSSVLRTSSYPALDASSADLRSSSAKVELDGFASSEGTAAHNMRLSKDRANSVKTYLVNSGVDAKRIKVKGFGETKPIADNSTEEGRITNRRVEFKK